MTERELTKLLSLCAPELSPEGMKSFIALRDKKLLTLGECRNVLCFNPDDYGLNLKEAYVTTSGVLMYFSKDGYGAISITTHHTNALGLYNSVSIVPLKWPPGNVAIRSYKVTSLTSLKQKFKLHDKRFNNRQ